MAKTKPKIKRIVRSLVNQLENKNIHVQQLILFGSQSTGSAKWHSDIDIAVISSSFSGKGLLKRQELLGEAIFPLQEPIEAIGYSPEEIKNIVPASFLSEIISKGKVVFKA